MGSRASPVSHSPGDRTRERIRVSIRDRAEHGRYSTRGRGWALGRITFVLFTAFRVLARCWPALLAWFLAGWAARALIIRLAAFVGNADDVFGLLILPVAILVQLAAYVGMFLAVRRELPNLSRADDPDPGETVPSEARRWRETLLAAILPFFLLYVAWNFIYQDLVDYLFSALNQGDLGGGDIAEYQVPVGVMSLTLIGAAFVVRWLLGRYASRLPRWVSGVATYLEAVWVLVALLVIRELLAGVPQWLATRRMFAWAVDGWASLRGDYRWLDVVGDVLDWTLGQAGTLIALPLAWLAFAAIIYFGTLPRNPIEPSRVAARAGERWARMPVWLRRIGAAISSGFLDRWGPVTLAARLIWRSGPVALGTYLLAFAVVSAGGEWLRAGIYRLLGPHETGWWFGASDAVVLVSSAVVGVLQIALVAAAFDHALRTDAADEIVEEAGDAVSSAAAPAAEPTTT